MPDKVIDIPGHGQIAFPDTMSEAEMNAAATKLYQQANPEKKQPPVKSWAQTAVDWLPAIGGGVGAIVGGGIPGAIAGGIGGEAARQMLTGETPSYTKVATQGALQGALEGTGAAIGAGMQAVAPRIMQAAVKPTLSMLKGVAKGQPVPRVVQTLLDEGINVTPAGLDKLNTLLTASRQQIKDAITEASATGAPGIAPTAVTSRLNQTVQKFATQVNPTSDLEAISKAGQDFLEAHGGQRIPLDTAQAIKQGTYAINKTKYGQLGTADTEAQKALARGLKEELEAQVPGIGKLNEIEGKQLEAFNAVGRRVALSGNRDPIGFAWVTHNPMMFLTALMDRSPVVKSLLARGLYQSAATVAKVSPDLMRAALVSVSGGPGDVPGPASIGSSGGQMPPTP